MRKFFLLLACLCGLCMGEDDPKCGELMKLPVHLIEYAEMAAIDGYEIENYTYDGKYLGKAACLEKIICNKVEYCIYIKSFNGEIQNVLKLSD